VKAGKIPADKLILFVSPDAGIDLLEQGEVDAILLDRMPARNFAQQGRARLAGEQLIPQVFGIAVSKGSSLLPELNRVLAEAQADGTVQGLVEQYLDVLPEEVLPATSVPFASPTP
jgi:ABC-type amino acid transport substrate-binding protein